MIHSGVLLMSAQGGWRAVGKALSQMRPADGSVGEAEAAVGKMPFKLYNQASVFGFQVGRAQWSLDGVPLRGATVQAEAGEEQKHRIAAGIVGGIALAPLALIAASKKKINVARITLTGADGITVSKTIRTKKVDQVVGFVQQLQAAIAQLDAGTKDGPTTGIVGPSETNVEPPAGVHKPPT